MARRHLLPLAALVLAIVVAVLFVYARSAAYLLIGMIAISLPAFFSTAVARAVGALFLAGLLFLFLRVGWSPASALFAASVVGIAAWRYVPHRVLRRLCVLVPSMVTLIYLTTLLMFAAPGSPFAQEKVTTAQVEAAKRAAWGVPEDPTEFFDIYVTRILQDFNFGPSLTVQGRSVMELLGPAFPVSLSLGLLALVLAVAIGLLLGVRAGLKPNSFADYSSMGLAVIGISLPNFVIGAIFMIVMALGLGWLPVAGWGSYAHLILPALTLSLPFAAYMARLARAGTIEVMQQDFVRTARAKGLGERAVVLKHALRGAILPVVSFLGPATAGIMTGSFVVETLFGIPGMGQWFVKSAINRDYSVVLGTALIYFGLIFVMNLLVDLAYAWLDPRVREDL